MKNIFQYGSLLLIALFAASCGGGGGGGVATTGTATVSWTAPAQNDNGEALLDLAGFKVHYGTSPGVYTHILDAGKVNTVRVVNLVKGKTYYFVVTAYNTAGVESDPSMPEQSKKVN